MVWLKNKLIGQETGNAEDRHEQLGKVVHRVLGLEIAVNLGVPRVKNPDTQHPGQSSLVRKLSAASLEENIEERDHGGSMASDPEFHHLVWLGIEVIGNYLGRGDKKLEGVQAERSSDHLDVSLLGRNDTPSSEGQDRLQ